MQRRGFLQLLLAGAAGLVLDPERLLWVPGKRTIFLPPERFVLGKPIPDWVLKETFRVLRNNLAFANAVNREYDREFRVSGARVGYTVNVRLPRRYANGH